MPIRVCGFLLVLAASLTACGGDSEDSASGEDEDYGIYFKDGPFEGWIDSLHEPFGDESWCYYRVTPATYSPGDEVTLELAAGSGYGPIAETTQLSYRCTSGSPQNKYGTLNDHTAGDPWQALRPDGAFYTKYDEDKEAYEDKWHPYTDSTSEDDAYDAFIHFKEVFTVPEGGQFIELRVEQPGGRFGGIRIKPTDYAIEIYPLPEDE